MKIQAVVFDFDGVLADTALDIVASVRATQRHYGVPEMSGAEIMSFVGWGAKFLIDNTVPVCAEHQSEALSWYQAYYAAHPCDETVVYPGVLETLARFQTMGVKMAVASNKPEALTNKIVDKLGLMEYFTCVIGPESVTRMKPDPEPLLLCAQRMETAPEYCMMVGDSYTDIVAGRNAGFAKTCAVLCGYGNQEKLQAEHADFTVTDRGQIAKLCNG